MEKSWSGDWQNDPEFMRAREKTRREMSTGLPKPRNDPRTTYRVLAHVSDSDGFLVGRDIKPRQSESQVFYHSGLFARLGLYCYNFQKGTDYCFKFLKRYYVHHGCPITKVFITLEARNPQDRRSPLTLETKLQFAGYSQPVKTWWETCLCRLEGNEEAAHDWNYEAISHHYKGEMPNWLSLDENHQQCYYEVPQSELLGVDDYWWLHLFTEFAFYSKWSGTLAPREIADSLPLKTQKVVVETRGEAAIQPREMLRAPNAIFYISFCCGNDPATGEPANYRAVVRKTMDGKPGHMRLEASCWTI